MEIEGQWGIQGFLKDGKNMEKNKSSILLAMFKEEPSDFDLLPSKYPEKKSKEVGVHQNLSLETILIILKELSVCFYNTYIYIYINELSLWCAGKKTM